MTIAKSELAELSRIALAVATDASLILASGYRSRPQADEKARADLVTEFDRRSEAFITERLTALSPQIPVIGEEQSGDAAARPKGLVWYVDPLDGTTNFVHGHPFFAVSIGLMLDDEPAAGAIVAPALALRYHGYRSHDGAGEAFRNDEPCAVSPVDTLAKSMIGTGFPPNRERAPQNNFGSFIEVKRGVQAVRRCGAAAIDLCFVADGTYEAFWERRLHTWDICAAATLILVAGGRVTSLDGTAIDYHSGNVVASNGRVHEPLVEAIQRGEKRQV